MIFSSTVPPSLRKAEGLVDYLAGRFTYHTREEWRALIAGGKIVCNGRPASPDDMVSAGDTVSYDAGEFDEPAADLSYRIVYEDEWLLGIDKPGNLLVHRAGRSFRNNLMYQLRHVHVPPYPMAHAVHRLDRGTSGIMCVAKNVEVGAALGRQFLEGKVEKTYQAVVRGTPEAREIDFPISKTAGSAVSCRHGVDPGGKPALTRIIASQPAGKHHALLTLLPLSGRTHQIRIHLAAVGAPIVGDRLYGTGEEGFPRQALHCASLTFAHPVTGKECRLEAPLPEDMKALIEQLTR